MVIILGWMALVVAIGTVVWRRGAKSQGAPAIERPPGPLPRLVGWLLIAFTVFPWARRRSAR